MASLVHTGLHPQHTTVPSVLTPPVRSEPELMEPELMEMKEWRLGSVCFWGS